MAVDTLDFVALDNGIVREDNARGIASLKSSFQPFGMQHPLRRMVTPPCSGTNPNRETK
jgi:hypothetical protein